MRKQSFRLKPNRSDGLILQVHNTLQAQQSRTNTKRIRFVNAVFNETSHLVCAIDNNGNIFLIDLECTKFWQLPFCGVCVFAAFSGFKPFEIIIGLEKGPLCIVNFESGETVGELDGHTTSVLEISHTDDYQYCLTSSTDEAIIWDLNTNTQAHQLSMKTNIKLKKVMFMPVSNNILACFQDDAIHIWKFGTFECLKQIVPETWNSHHLKCITFSKDGRGMVIGGYSPNLVVFSLDTWSLIKVIDLVSPITGVKSMKFLPQMFDGGANKILAILANDCYVYFLNIDSAVFVRKNVVTDGAICKLNASPNGKYLACVLESGEVNIYLSSKLIEDEKTLSTVPSERSFAGGDATCSSYQAKKTSRSKESLCDVQKQIKETLDLSKLKPILKEFGEYPESYRVMIWKTILQVPGNQQSYRSLVSKNLHIAYNKIEDQFPLENKSLLKNFKKLLSNLAHWSPLFGEVKYLPLLVFPFVKLFHFDPFVCFEVVATIIMNWCQHWFEYFPYPPINILSMVENVLADNDQELIEFYSKNSITSQCYAWTLLENAFSEVLSKKEWLKFWDHVVSNEPCYLLLACVSYSLVFRNTIMSITEPDDFEFFFHNPNPINMKLFIAKTYKLLSNTKPELHPRQYYNNFTPLTTGSYNVYNEYPKFIVDYQSSQLQEIRMEEEELKKEKERLLMMKKKQEDKMFGEGQSKADEAKLKKLEEMYRTTVIQEEERVARERKKIQELKRELRHRELEMLSEAKEKLIARQTKERQAALDRLIEDIARKRAREENEFENIEEELHQHYAELEAHKNQLEMEIGLRYNDFIPNDDQSNLQKQQDKLKSELSKLREEAVSRHHAQHLEITKKITIVKDLLQRVEMELAKEVAARQQHALSVKDNMKVLQMESKTKQLEGEVQELLGSLARLRLEEAECVSRKIEHSRAERQMLNEQQTNLVENFIKNSVEEIYSNIDKRYSGPRYVADAGDDDDSSSSRYCSSQMNVVNSAMDLRRQVIEEGKRSSSQTSR